MFFQYVKRLKQSRQLVKILMLPRSKPKRFFPISSVSASFTGTISIVIPLFWRLLM
jgi:hypothetical protein